MEKLTFKVETFEGPLDLLLYLISQHKMQLYDIQIDLLLEQYLIQMEDLPMADLETASDFLEMASRLVYMKSAMLLPKYEDEGEKLKQELTGQLLEYQSCKEAAMRLRELWCREERFWRPATQIEPDLTYHHVHKSTELLDAYLAMQGKVKRRMPPPREAFSGIVKRRVVSVQSRIASILNRLYQKSMVGFDSLFRQSEDRSEMVATFLAVLELIKSKRIVMDDTGDIRFGPHAGSMPEDLEYDEEENQ